MMATISGRDIAEARVELVSGDQSLEGMQPGDRPLDDPPLADDFSDLGVALVLTQRERDLLLSETLSRHGWRPSSKCKFAKILHSARTKKWGERQAHACPKLYLCRAAARLERGLLISIGA